LKTSIDLNCDLGEGMGHEADIIPYITSANIACGFHTYDMKAILETLLLCHEQKLAIGAHPSFEDREHFGRREMSLDRIELAALIYSQVNIMEAFGEAIGFRPAHVKPHGALYNMSARDIRMAGIIARNIKSVDPSLVLFGLSGSASIKAGRNAGLQVANEVFADRTYQANGALTPRTQPNAMIHDPDEAVRQVLQIVIEGCVTAVDGTRVPLEADTICIHGDGPNAVAIVKAVHAALIENGIQLAPPGRPRHPDA
jgi:UPF0271 protein